MIGSGRVWVVSILHSIICICSTTDIPPFASTIPCGGNPTLETGRTAIGLKRRRSMRISRFCQYIYIYIYPWLVLGGRELDLPHTLSFPYKRVGAPVRYMLKAIRSGSLLRAHGMYLHCQRFVPMISV
jgi:hypothetical protein